MSRMSCERVHTVDVPSLTPLGPFPLHMSLSRLLAQGLLGLFSPIILGRPGASSLCVLLVPGPTSVLSALLSCFSGAVLVAVWGRTPEKRVFLLTLCEFTILTLCGVPEPVARSSC